MHNIYHDFQILRKMRSQQHESNLGTDVKKRGLEPLYGNTATMVTYLLSVYRHHAPSFRQFMRQLKKIIYNKSDPFYKAFE